jgi:WD40 repeat protein/serine/threonine protein kinase
MLRQACRELDQGVRQGGPVRAEQLLANLSEIAADPEAAVELIYTEVLARQEMGENVPLEEWYQRYPQWQGQLERQFKVHLLLEGCLKDVEDDAQQARFGHYDELEEIGQGGKGIVYKARDTVLGRTVALKMISASADATALMRFRREAEAISLLQHPHIVQVYEVNQWQGQPYLALEYVDGVSLAEYIRLRHAGLAAPPAVDPLLAAGLSATLARAMHHAHERGIVHRDLKPANVLLSSTSAASDGLADPIDCIRLDQPKITDFGLSARYGEATGPAGSPTFIGTPGYMAPEQIWSDPRLIGPPADLYALGAILYELLTGTLYQADQAAEDSLDLRGELSMASRQLVEAGVPRDLAAICSKCLAYQPSDRYASAAELADDLDAYAEGRPVKARASNRLEKTWKWIRRSPAAATLMLMTSLLLTTLLVGSLWYNMQLRAQREFSRRSLYNLQLANVGATWQRDPVQGLELLTDPDRCPADLRDFTWAFLHQACRRERLSIAAHTEGIYAMAFSHDGRTLASASNVRHAVEDPKPYELRLWDARTGQLRATLHGSRGRATDLLFTPDGKRLVTSVSYRDGGKNRGEVTIWDLDQGRVEETLAEHRQPVKCIRFSPDGGLLAAGTDRKILIWNAAQRRLVRTLGPCPDMVGGIAFSPSGHQLAAVSRHTLMVWDVDDGALLGSTETSIGQLWGVVYNPDGQTLATNGNHQDIFLWDTETLSLKHTLRGHTNSVRSVAFSHDGATLVSGGDDFAIRLWDLPTASERTAYRGHNREVNAVVLTPNEQTFVTAGMDGQIKTWDINQPPLELEGHSGRVLCATFTSDGRYFITGGLDNTVRLWETASRKVVAHADSHERPVRAVAVGSASDWLASAGEDCRIVLYDLPSMAVRRTISGHEHFVTALAVSADGKQLASASLDGSLKIWASDTGRLLQRLDGDHGQIKAFAFTAEGRELITSGSDGVVRIWDLSSGRETAVLNEPGLPVRALALNPNATLLATGGNDQNVQIWDLRDRSLRRTLKGHSHWVGAVTFSPDGKTLVSATGDRTPNVPGEIKFWDPETGQVRATFTGHAAPLAFSPDGQVLLVGANDHRISLWEKAGRADSDRTASVNSHDRRKTAASRD